MRVIGGTVENVGGVLLRVVPLRFSEYDFAIAYDCDWSFNAWNHDEGTYGKAFIRVRYRLPKYALEGSDAYLSFRTTSGSRPVPIIPTGTVGPAYAVGNENVPTTVYSVMSHNNFQLSPETWRQYAGYTNQAAWRGFPARSLMFYPPESHQTNQVAGTYSYDVDFRFEACRVLWTQCWDTGGNLVDLEFVGGGLRVPEVDYASVFGF